ncbi:hypothetical protein L2E82_46993 [Cichorium intybus]|uniref:Uncharacterized protein n=1 Tax=Cichorium intybus TaxID=13427 RepID=A0ACB8YU81_CICIN|nr:hypothetical protein L2E82_46993 [Cichorium intybus]
MLSQSHFVSQDTRSRSSLYTNYRTCCSLSSPSSTLALAKSRRIVSMTTRRSTLLDGIGAVTGVEHSGSKLDHFAIIANKLADAASDVIRKYFRKRFEIVDKEDLSPVTIADRAVEEAMISIIRESLPSHAM